MQGFRVPAEIISEAVWLYNRFPLSLHEVEELLLARGIIVSRETVRQWCAGFGPQLDPGAEDITASGGRLAHLRTPEPAAGGPAALKRSGPPAMSPPTLSSDRDPDRRDREVPPE